MSVLSALSPSKYCLLILISKQSVTRSFPRDARRGESICLCRENSEKAGHGPRALNSGPRAVGFTGRNPEHSTYFSAYVTMPTQYTIGFNRLGDSLLCDEQHLHGLDEGYRNLWSLD